ncbi:MAG: phage major capsid protein, partial [Alistipes sp.]
MKTIKELKEERAQMHAQMHTIVTTAESRGESAEFTSEERKKYDEIKTSYEAIDGRIKIMEEDEIRSAAIATKKTPAEGDGGKIDTPEVREKFHQEELRTAFLDVIRGRQVKPEIRAELFTGAGENSIIIPKLIADKVEIALRDTGDFLGAVETIIT